MYFAFQETAVVQVAAMFKAGGAGQQCSNLARMSTIAYFSRILENLNKISKNLVRQAGNSTKNKLPEFREFSKHLQK